MTTVSFEGMHTVQNAVELCWWALTQADSANAEYAPTHPSSGPSASWPFLLGTGMEDFFGNSFSLSWLDRESFTMACTFALLSLRERVIHVRVRISKTILLLLLL